MRALKPGPGSGEHPKKEGQPKRSAAPSGAPGRIGLPEEPPSPAQEPQADLKHLELALQHWNAQQLGRDVPFGIWALRNGLHVSLNPGSDPFDWFMDT